MNRYFLPASDWAADEQLTLTGEEAKHCAQVMRQRAGETIEVFDGRGRAATCEITEASRSAVVCRIETIAEQTPPSPHLTLLVGVPKGKLMDWIIQKCVELGVNRIVPLLTERTVVKAEGREAEKKREKWQRVALEACKQCGQNHLVEIAELQDLPRALESLPSDGVGIVGSLEEGARPLKKLAERLVDANEIFLAVGPEGDFSNSEYHSLSQRGFIPASLGPLVLRVETASIMLTAFTRLQFP